MVPSEKLLLIASEELRTASISLSMTISHAMDTPGPDDTNFWDFVEPVQDTFLAAAKKDLGIDVGKSRERS